MNTDKANLINNGNIQILFLNVNGLRSKTRLPEFLEMIKDYDIIAFAESKTDDFDNFNLPGFKFTYMKNRKRNKRVRSGGIFIAIKDSIKDNFEIDLKLGSEIIIWLKEKKKVLKTKNKMALGFVYVPPIGSFYYDDESFENIEKDICMLKSQKFAILLVGDFNARTRTLDDFIEFDDTLLEQVTISADQISTETNENLIKLKNANIPLKRSSQDCAKNSHGDKLIDLCCNCDIFIMNGRIGADKDIGRTTCQDKSLIDYVIGSPDVLCSCNDLRVEDFNPLFSDVHNPISISLHKIPGNEKVVNTEEVDTEYLTENIDKRTCLSQNWNEDNIKIFNNHLNDEKLIHLADKLNSLEMDIENIDKTCDIINSSVDTISDMLNDSGKKTFSKRMQNRRNTSQKLWFGKECRIKRKKFLKCRRAYLKENNPQKRNEMNSAKKEYKQAINKFKNKELKKFNNKLRNLKDNNPRQFWSLIKDKNKESLKEIEMNTLFEHFRNLNKGNDDNQPNLLDMQIEGNEHLDAPVTEEEVRKITTKLKNNKSPGIDGIVNEYIKYGIDKIANVLTAIFNLVLKAGIFPKSWLTGIIKPIYKNKGSKSDANNYRGITLVSCLGKVFTGLLNKRLSDFLEQNGVLNENQAGFRSGYSTVDHIFNLNLIINKFLSDGKKLYCAFVDYEKAFDTVWRKGLWFKLLNQGIKGRCFKVIVNMYDGIKSLVEKDGKLSEIFPCNMGVRQGENLSPLLFAVFLNDLQSSFSNFGNEGLVFNLDDQQVLRLHALLYADDTVLFANSAESLQKSLNILLRYSRLWKLKVNVNKTKIMIFSKNGKWSKKHNFTYNEETVDIVNEFKYLGIVFKNNGRFLSAIKLIKAQANKAMRYIISRARAKNMPIDIQLKLFDTLVIPIMTYGAEVWGFEHLNMLDQLELQFLKLVMNVRRSTPKYMIYGELGRLPVSITIKLRMTGFWGKMLTGKQEKLSYNLYQMLLSDWVNVKWISKIKNILDESGLSYIWDMQYVHCAVNLMKILKLNFKDQFLQQWNSEMQVSNKGKMYSMLKKGFEMENYLKTLPSNLSQFLCWFRTANHSLPVEIGRWSNIDHHLRKCDMCTASEVGDEYHTLLKCPAFTNIRHLYIPQYFSKYPSKFKFDALMSENRQNKMVANIAKFIREIFRFRKRMPTPPVK